MVFLRTHRHFEYLLKKAVHTLCVPMQIYFKIKKFLCTVNVGGGRRSV